MESASVIYGFVGLGQMGHGMAKNLCEKMEKNSKIVVFDINPEALNKFVKEFGSAGNVIKASSPKEVAQQSNIILTSVPRAPHVQQLFLDPDTGLLAAEKRGNTLYLELSTIDAGVSSDIGKKVVSEGYGQFVDAPCSGGSMGAEKGALSYMVGCPADLFPKVFNILKMMGKDDGIFHCGDAGTGLKTKLLNNYLSSITTIATAETINIGVKGGLDPHKLNEVINASSGMSFNSAVNNPVPGLTPGSPASNGYKPGFSLELCLGVLELAVKSANDLGAKTVLGQPMLDAYREVASQDVFKGKDCKIIYKWIEAGGTFVANGGNHQ